MLPSIVLTGDWVSFDQKEEIEMKNIGSESNGPTFRGVLLSMAGAIVMMGLVYGSPALADDDDKNRVFCPCFTSHMIDALMLSTPGFIQHDGESRGPEQDGPFGAVDANVICQPPQGPRNLEVEIFLETDVSEFGVGVGFLDDEGSCTIVSGDPDIEPNGLFEHEGFYFSVGVEENPDGSPGGISRREMRACKREILKSLMWRTFFCPNTPED